MAAYKIFFRRSVDKDFSAIPKQDLRKVLRRIHVRHYADRKQEHFLCASINGANEILNIRVVSIGLIDRTPVHPRKVFADALSDRASAIIVAHNHPTGSLEPSATDVEVTGQIKSAGSVVGIALLDHIIFNRSEYFSFLESGRL
ncbi:MAG: JAB domain-containing protein [Deltaproteobacteria bacterium]